MVSAQVLKDTSLIEIRVQNTDKVLAVQIANTMASEFVQFVSEMNQERMSKSLTFLQEQETAVKADLAIAYDELSRIQSRPDNAASITRDISTKNQVVVALRGDLAKLQTDVTMLSAGVRQVEAAMAATPQSERTGAAYQALVTSQAQKVAELANASARASAMAQEIASLERSVTSLEGKLVTAQNEEAVVKADATRLEATLNLLSSKMVEAQMAHSLNLGETTISVVSPAMEPRNPVKPRKLVNMAVAGVLGGFVSVLLVFVLEYMDNTVKTQDDVQKYLNIGTLGSIPVVDARQRRKR
jgi:capsular polysaccharide biosynthesis protein